MYIHLQITAGNILSHDINTIVQEVCKGKNHYIIVKIHM